MGSRKQVAAVATESECLRPWRSKNVTIPLLSIALGLALLPWGTQIFRVAYLFLRALPLSSFFATAVQLSSITIVVGIIVLIYLLDRSRLVFLPYFVMALLLAGAVNSVIKETAGRSRPEWSIMMSKDKRLELQEFQDSHPAMEIPITKVDHWYGLNLNRPFFMDRYSSFPSGHTTGVFVIAAFLAMLYPRARKVWFIGAIGCALARVRGERHYMEDVLVAAGLATLVAQWVFSWHWPLWLGHYFTRADRPTTSPEPVHNSIQPESTE